jgi:hypothetical protein
MQKEFDDISENQVNLLEKPEINFKKYSFASIKIKLVRRILFKRFFWISFLRRKGLSKAEAKTY